MKYEVIETAGEWVVQNEGVEVARFAEQADALDHVASCLKDVAAGEQASLSVRYRARG